MGELKNEFSWSKTRDEAFRSCRRQYYFNYYGYWNGWNQRDCDERTRKIYVLKKLQTRHIWVGSKVHDRIKDVLLLLRAGRDPIPVEQAIERTIKEMRVEFKHSREANYWKNPKGGAFFEHEYEQEIADEEWKRAADKVDSCLRLFYESDVFAEIQKLDKKQWLETEEFSSFMLDGIKVNVVLDFSYRDGDEIIIYDWKTGKTDEERHDLQLACYALYATEKWGVTPDKVKTIEFNLVSGNVVPYHSAGVDLEAVKQHIKESASSMQELLHDVPSNAARENNFEFTNKPRRCDWCNFKKVCPKWAD